MSSDRPDLPPLISADDLAALRATGADLLILDCRFDLADPSAGGRLFERGHLPGAVHADLDMDLSGPKTGQNGRHPLPAPERWQTTLQGWGLGPDTRVVVYDDSGAMYAARAWWMLRWAGHDAVQVLDGGWAAWLAQGRPVSQAAAPRAPSGFTARWRPAMVLDTADIEANLARQGPLRLIDARAADRFRGENETLDPVGGHIPGALNRFFRLNLAANGHFKPAAQLREEFEALLAGLPLEQIVHQCGSGVTACHNLLAMDLAGLGGTRLYAGSWSAWCADPARPVVR